GDRRVTSMPNPSKSAEPKSARKTRVENGNAKSAPGPVPAPSGSLLPALLDAPELASPVDVRTLQRSTGNRAVRRWLAGRAVQARLTVGPAGDRYEQEADRVANQVMQASPPAAMPLAQRT